MQNVFGSGAALSREKNVGTANEFLTFEYNIQIERIL